MKYKLVPVEPTDEMKRAANGIFAGSWIDIYKAMLAAAPKVEQEPDGYIEIETYGDIEDFGFAASFEQGVLDHIKEKVLRLIDEDITVPIMHVKPFYLAPPTPQIPQEWKDARKMVIDALQRCTKYDQRDYDALSAMRALENDNG